MPPLTSKASIDRLVERLVLQFSMSQRAHIASTVAEEYAALSDSRIQTYIPNLVEHGVRSRLRRELHPLSPGA